MFAALGGAFVGASTDSCICGPLVVLCSLSGALEAREGDDWSREKHSSPTGNLLDGLLVCYLKCYSFHLLLPQHNAASMLGAAMTAVLNLPNAAREEVAMVRGVEH